MELKDLAGERELTGVEYETEQIPAVWGGGTEESNSIFFTLDGVTYRVTENPEDGYRSSMREIEISDRQLRNTFAPCRVLARYVDGPREYAGANDLLECIDVVTGQPVLLVGTENTDDYYPSYIASFWPERMAVNARVKETVGAVDPDEGTISDGPRATKS